MGNYRAYIFVCFFSFSIPSYSEEFFVENVYKSTFEKKEREISSCIDYHLGLILKSEKYGITQSALKSARINLEFVRAKIQIYNQKCIDINEAFDYIKSDLECRFVNLDIYDTESYKDSFYTCYQSDLTRRLYEAYEQKKKLPPRIEWGITICLFGYFVWLIPYPPFQVAGYAIMAYGAEKVIDGYFSEQDKNYDKENRNE